MAFITDSVGFGGRNLSQDVKIIQWMLQNVQHYYGKAIFSESYGIAENGVLDIACGSAIIDIIKYPKYYGEVSSQFTALRTKCISQ